MHTNAGENNGTELVRSVARRAYTQTIERLVHTPVEAYLE